MNGFKMRLEYFLVLWILLLCPRFIYMNGSEERDRKVLILGAGMSGISAAKTLHNAGFDNFHILEGSSRIGGRIKEATLGNTTVELGALWIYGKGSNPIYKMADDHNLSFVSSFTDDWTVRNIQGEDVTEAADEVYARLEKITKKFDFYSKQSLKHNTTDYSVRSGLRNLKWLPTSYFEETIEAFVLDFEIGVLPSVLSGKHVHFNEPFETFDNNDMMAANDKRGFSTIIKNSFQEIKSDINSHISFNKIVAKIIQFKGFVKVITQDGSVYTADYVILTFSIGVLQHREVVFEPELPGWKMNAIDKFGISPYMHIYLQFEFTFWDETTYILYSSNERGKHSIWLNMNRIHPKSDILMLSVMDKEARRMEKMNDIAIIHELHASLQKIYPTANITKPRNYVISRWLSDPLFRGAFSYWPTSFTTTDMDSMAAPVGRIHFAGEHLHNQQYSFVNSAYLSGSKTATDVLNCLTKTESCVLQSNRTRTSN